MLKVKVLLRGGEGGGGGGGGQQPFLFCPVTCLLLPGWNVTDGRGTGGAMAAAGGGSGGGGGVSGAAAVSGNKCVVLKDNFPITQGGEGGDAPAEYFFWQVLYT